VAIIKYREFTIRTGADCDAKNPKRNPVQLLDRNGYHVKYFIDVACAQHAANAWWTWQARVNAATPSLTVMIEPSTQEQSK